MTNLAVVPMPVEVKSTSPSNVISFSAIKRGSSNESDKIEARDSCDNSAGKDSEVYAFQTREEIESMISVFDRHIEEAENDCQMRIAYRNRLIFVVGINIGVRGSDLRTLKWSFFFDNCDDGTLKFKKFYTLMPMKQRKKKKYVKLFFNQAVKQAVYSYIEQYPIESLDDYVFFSRKGDKPVEVQTLRKVVKDAAAEAGIERNIGSHSLRKTFGRFCFEEAEDKTKALVVLQKIFNHSDSVTTLKYIGLLDDEMEDMFNSINLGIDFI